jgi:hypothetical protein
VLCNRREGGLGGSALRGGGAIHTRRRGCRCCATSSTSSGRLCSRVPRRANKLQTPRPARLQTPRASSHEELDTHHKALGTHKQSTPRAGEGLSAGAARLGRAALQNHLFELQDAVVVRMLYVGMQVCMLNCGKASHITDKKRRETQQSYLIVSYNSYLPVPCGELPAANRRGRDVPGGTIPVHWYAGRHRQLSATA